jgi:uroporphyrinogen decarboxylase
MALDHKEPDRLPIDLGSTLVTSNCLKPYATLMEHLGLPLKEVRLID